MSECLFCLYHTTKHTDEEYCKLDNDYHWTSYDYCTYHDKTIDELEDENIYYNTGCKNYTEY